MAYHLVLKDFEVSLNGMRWVLRASEVADDTVVPVSTLQNYGLVVTPYVSALHDTMITRHNEGYGRSEEVESLSPELNAGISSSDGAQYVGTSTKSNLGSAANIEDALSFLDDGQYDPGSVAVAQIIQGGQPVATETLTVGADVYEADGVGANINFVIGGSAEATMDNLLAAAVANGTENLYWDKLSATVLRLRSADAPQGNIIGADPDIAVTEAMTNYVFDCGNVNLNTLAGRAAGQQRVVIASLALNAGHIAAGEARISFPADVTDAVVSLYTATNVAHAIGTDSWAIDNGDVLLTLPGGGPPDLVAGDIVRVVAVL